MTQYDNIENAIRKGVWFLYDHQYPNGEFCCYICPDDEMKMCVTHSNVFPTSLIANSIFDLRYIPEVNEILDKAAAFLQYQAMRGGTWNNFTILNPLFPICPPDVDNTACAAIVLQKLGKDFEDNKTLILANRNDEGLFYTWFTWRTRYNPIKTYWLLSLRALKHPIDTCMFWRKTEATRYDIDAVVNANVLFYLGLNKNTAPVLKYMLDIIEKGKESDCDLWYRNPFTIYYFFSRNYKAGCAELEPAAQTIKERILLTAKADYSLGESILDTALGIISLINCGDNSTTLDKAVDHLVGHQNRSGAWQRWGVYYGGPKKLQTYGSEEMTTGFCLEALALYRFRLLEIAKKNNPSN